MKQLRLNTFSNTLKTFARVLRAYNSGTIDREKYRDYVFGLSGFLGYWKQLQDVAIQKDLEEIKTDIETLKGRVGK